MRLRALASLFIFVIVTAWLWGQAAPSPPPASPKSAPHAASSKSALDAGTVSNGVYHNSAFGFSCKIPAGWVLRTEEMNAPDEDTTQPAEESAPRQPAENKSNGRVLLAAFSRPPAARGEDVNSSIVIAAESAAAYPGLKEAVQYFEPVTGVATAQGFAVVNEPYEFAVGAKKLVRSDFQKDVGTRVMRQSTLVMLARGYAVSFTFIGGTEDELEGLIEALTFAAGAK